MQAQESIKAFCLVAAKQLKLEEAELLKKCRAKADDAAFIKLLRDNGWKSQGRKLEPEERKKLLQDVVDAL